MNDDSKMKRFATEHARYWQLIPWCVNGTLSEEEVSMAEQHFAACSECKTELELQRGLQAQLRDGDPVLMAPQSAWQKMAERLDGEDEAVAYGRFKPGAHVSGVWRWAVAAQTLLVIGLTAVVWQQGRSSTVGSDVSQTVAVVPTDSMLQPRYETLTSNTEAIAEGSVRVVFRKDVTLTDVNALLRELSTQIVAGPSEANVYTLAVPKKTSNDEPIAAMLKALRSDSRVVFAEPSEQR